MNKDTSQGLLAQIMNNPPIQTYSGLSEKDVQKVIANTFKKIGKKNFPDRINVMVSIHFLTEIYEKNGEKGLRTFLRNADVMTDSKGYAFLKSKVPDML
jgi:hypothetical protein